MAILRPRFEGRGENTTVEGRRTERASDGAFCKGLYPDL